MNTEPARIVPSSSSNTLASLAITDVVNDICEHASQGNYQHSMSALQQIMPLLSGGEVMSLLSELALGRRSCCWREGVWLTGAATDLDADKIQLLKQCAEQIAEHFQLKPPVILVALLDQAELPPYMIRIINGVGVLFAHQAHFQRHILAHELTHAIAATGHHFLDESLAYYVENLISGQSFVTALQAFEMETLLQISDITTLKDRTPNEVNHHYQQGAALIYWLVCKTSSNKVYQFYCCYPLITTGTSVYKALEDFFDIRLCELEPTPLMQPDSPLLCLEQAAYALNQSYFSGKLSDIDNHIRALLQHASALSRHQQLALIRGLFSRICYAEKNIEQDRATLLALAERYLEQQNKADATTFSVAIMIDCIKMGTAASYLDIQELATSINQHFRQGLQLHPDNGELNLMKAKSLYDTPEVQGGDKKLAQAFFAKAEQDPEFGRFICLLTAHYHEDA
ncbi:hypothetical protein Q3O60_02845 [Alkalimonas collagenimarina]|uniref:Peptidase M48 domain-containing protein n=1 Tax=Alkalimonas collagenimarina TaxID=400390 RepID=A0ABT9GVS6_9GAMM|nr:hypothetical protein [Alkalimonas collagenimarina]MDP4535123.1 hypothetical protein [Alkalimonas collagenimarina]